MPTKLTKREIFKMVLKRTIKAVQSNTKSDDYFVCNQLSASRDENKFFTGPFEQAKKDYQTAFLGSSYFNKSALDPGPFLHVSPFPGGLHFEATESEIWTLRIKMLTLLANGHNQAAAVLGERYRDSLRLGLGLRGISLKGLQAGKKKTA